MHKPAEDLIAEHRGILLMLKVMEKIAGRMRRGEALDEDHLRKMVEFLRNFVDKCHHGKEEGILFPEIVKTAAHVGAVNELLGEHMSGRDLIGGIVASLRAYAPGNPDAFHIAVNCEEYARLLVLHIEKETPLLTAADAELPEALQEDIARRFDALERGVIGEGKHEEYHGWLKEFKAAYLGA